MDDPTLLFEAMAILVIDGVLVHGGALLTRLGPTICLLVVMLVLPLAARDHFLPPSPFLCTFAWGPHSGSEQLGARLSLFVQPGLRACCGCRVWQAFFLGPHLKVMSCPAVLETWLSQYASRALVSRTTATCGWLLIGPHSARSWHLV